jgi:serine protease Do
VGWGRAVQPFDDVASRRAGRRAARLIRCGAAAVGLLLLAGGSSFAADPPRGKSPVSPLSELAERARISVVHVRGSLMDRSPRPQARSSGTAGTSVGSGFLVDRKGAVITNEHVVRGATDLRVRLYDGREFSACVLGTDELADVALLRIEAREVPPMLPLGDSDKVRVGEEVVAIGSPFGFAHSVTAGIVSATERVIDPGAEQTTEAEEPPYSFYIQTDASINLGNSGGPLLDSAGRVIGINAAFWGGPQPSAGVGFAIPVNVVKMLLPRLREAGEAPRSFLGVESQPVTPILASAFGLPSLRGALVSAVEKGSPAEAGGLEAGDIVTSWGEHPLATRDDFRIFAQLTAPGVKVRVNLLRDGRPLERQVTTRPAPRASRTRHPWDCRFLPPEPAASVGFEVREVARARAAELPGGRGVQVSRVTGGAAREANLRTGDIILRVARSPVGNVEELRRRLADWKRESPLPLLVRTRVRTFWTALPPR